MLKMKLGIMKGALLLFSTLIALSLCQIQNHESRRTEGIPQPHHPSRYSPVTSFSWNLFQASKLANPTGNFVLSPVILQFLLAVLENAAAGETHRQLREAIGIDDARALSKLFRPITNNVQLEAATGIFVDAAQTLNPGYANYTRSVSADIYLTDFINNPDAAKNAINSWASDATHGTINNLIGSASDIRASQIVLVTAIFFHSNWKYSFNSTNPQMFFSGPGKTNGRIVDFMELKRNFAVDVVDLGQNNVATVLELPYENPDYSMLLIVPNEDVDLGQFIKQMDAETFEKIIKKTSTGFPRLMTLRMPKFKIKSRFSIVNALLKMGVTDLFTQRSRLPYMGLRDEPRVSDILQQAMLVVDEQGTIASAASFVILLPLSFTPHEDLVFTIDRPFISVIADKKDNIPLFISKIYNPTL